VVPRVGLHPEARTISSSPGHFWPMRRAAQMLHRRTASLMHSACRGSEHLLLGIEMLEMMILLAR